MNVRYSINRMNSMNRGINTLRYIQCLADSGQWGQLPPHGAPMVETNKVPSRVAKVPYWLPFTWEKKYD